MAITNLLTVKALLRIPAGSMAEDAALAIWLSAADRAVKNYLKRDIEQTTYPGASATGDSGYYAGNYSPYLMLRQTPVTSITSVYLDATGYFGHGSTPFAAATLLVDGTDFALNYDGCLPGTTTPCSYSGILQRLGGAWPAVQQSRLGRLYPVVLPGIGNIKIAYQAGWPVVPPDLADACAMFVATLRRTARTGAGLQSENLGAYSYSVATSALNSMPELGSLRQILASYRRIMI